jgi:hypothetical protein
MTREALKVQAVIPILIAALAVTALPFDCYQLLYDSIGLVITLL